VSGPGPIVEIGELRHVYKRSGVVALDGVSLDVARGSAVAIVGQNGSGKTTLTRHLNGLLRPTSGRVVVDGHDAAREPVQALARSVGYVFQNPTSQLFARTVAEELAYGPRNLGVPRAELDERVTAVADELGLVDVLDGSPHRLPFARRKLVAIGGVLTMRTPLVVLDEPTTGQDHRTGRAIAELIEALRAGGTTVICATHDMLFVADVADRVVALSAGRVVADDVPRVVLSDLAALRAAGLAPPQITELSLALPGRGDRRGALTVQELVDEVRAAS
jgi:energy-coupling factor transport system ATP-binding protein